MPQTSRFGPPARIGLSLAAVTVCWAYLYYPWLAGHVVIPYDAIDENYPTLFFASQSLRHGQLPWWNPYLFTGFPQISDPQALLFSPSIVLPMAAVANPTPHWLDIIVLVHVLFGGIGMVGLLRLMGLSVPAAIFGAIITIGGGCLPARLEHTALLISTSTLPWVGWALLALCKHPSPRRGFVLGIAIGWMGLHLVQTTFIALLLMAFALAATVACSRDRIQRIRGLIYPLLVGALVTLAICGVQVAAVLTFLPETVREHLPLSASSQNSAPWRELLTFLRPDALHTFAPHYNGPIDITESIIYCGYLAAAGFFLGLILLLRAAWMPRMEKGNNLLAPEIFRLFAFLLLFCLLYALGTHTPFYAFLYHVVPGIALFRRPVDAMFIVTLCLSPIAALGFERVLGWLRTMGHTPAQILAVSVLPIALLCWDLGSHTLHPNRSNSWPASLVAPLPDRFAMIGLLHHGTANPDQPDWRVEFNQPGPFWPDLPAVAKIYSTQGYNPLTVARYKDVFGTTPNGYAPVEFTKWMPGYASSLFGLLGVKYIVSAKGRAADSLARKAGLRLAFSADGMNAWETTNHLPRLFSPSETIAATPADAPEATAGVADLSKTVVIEARARTVAACGVAPLHAIRLASYRLNDVSIQTTSGRSSGWLVMTDPDSAGWHAYADGREIPLYRADGYMRAVCVPRGKHLIAFRFEPFRQIAAALAQALP